MSPGMNMNRNIVKPLFYAFPTRPEKKEKRKKERKKEEVKTKEKYISPLIEPEPLRNLVNPALAEYKVQPFKFISFNFV